MTDTDFGAWLDDMTASPAAGEPAVIDSALVTTLADLLAANEDELGLTVRCLLDVHEVPLRAYEIRTGNWRVDLLPATARAVLTAAVATMIMQQLTPSDLPVVVLSAVAGLLFSFRRVEISPGELVLHARLHNEVTGRPNDLGELYEALPQDVRAELTMAELGDAVERFHQAGLARWTKDGITFSAPGRPRKVRLVVREPGFALAASQARDAETGRSVTLARKVFVIHGRDEPARKAVFDLLRALDLEPQEWEPLVAATNSTSPSLNEVVVNGLSAGRAQAVVAILTPDDVVTLHPALRAAADPADETSTVMQPRPNVLIELGLAMSAYRNRTILVQFGQLRRIADLDGLNVIRFDGSATAIGKLAARLKLAGCAVDESGSDWRDPQRFHGLDSYNRHAPAARR
jgi:predicted nucleotide-binding protein